MGRTPIFAASSVPGITGEHLRQRLIQLGANVHVKDDLGVPPALWALRDRSDQVLRLRDMVDIFRRLEKTGFGVDVTDMLGQSARSYVRAQLLQEIDLYSLARDAKKLAEAKKMLEQVSPVTTDRPETLGMYRMGLLR